MTNIEDYNQKMNKTIDVFIKELGTLRTGRANSNMLDLIKVDVYGQKMPINQIGTITTPEPRTLNIQVWDLNNVALIDAAIKKSELGLNPQIDGQLIRLPIPALSEERRNEIKKLIKTMGEKCKVSIRNIRREANDELKKSMKKPNLCYESSKKKAESICSRPSLTQLTVINLVDREFPLHNVGVPRESAKERHRTSRHASRGKRDARSFTATNQPCRRQDSRIVRL